MKLIIAIFLALSLVACKDWGTEGGNPEMDQVSSPMIGGEFLSRAICEQREICSGLIDNACKNLVENHPNVTKELRMDGFYATLKDLFDDEAHIKISMANTNVCIKAIYALDCSSSLAQQAFDPSSYDDIHLSLRSSTSCGDIFKLKQ